MWIYQGNMHVHHSNTVINIFTITENKATRVVDAPRGRACSRTAGPVRHTSRYRPGTHTHTAVPGYYRTNVCTLH
jgi:hypothetical protein